ncbi:MAG TPA: alpha/beta hydrolase, partial [Dongiaceae bacterium]|nr:alpha/beta hydrolase [Dongiaceae bacterium]
MTSIAARIVKAYTRRVIKKVPRDADHLVRHLRRVLGDSPLPIWLPRGVRRTSFTVENVRGEWLRVKQPRQVILYLHGGGYIAGKPATYLTLCGKLASALQADVYLPDYRLAPEHPFPAAVEDALTAYRFLLTQFPADKITVMGDSAGGSLALGTTLALRDAGMPLPKCNLAFSPMADLTAPHGSRNRNQQRDDMFTPEMYNIGIDLYGRTDADRRNPHASPAFGDYTGMPPLFLTVDKSECMHDDSVAVVERARAAGVNVTFIECDGLLHVWPIFYPLLPEARRDVAQAILFI